jgi:hypothetical protein
VKVSDPLKEMAIMQGYVPGTCTLTPGLGGPLIFSEVNAGRNPCWGCNMDRSECHGGPKKENYLEGR